VEEQPRPWYAPGLYRRIQEARRFRPQPTPRKSWRQRLRERGLHWSVELVIGIFVAVAAVSLATLALDRPGGASALTRLPSAPTVSTPVATPDCIAAPIAGSTRRVCTH